MFIACFQPLRRMGVDPQNPSLIAAFDAEQVLPKVAVTPDGHTYVCRFDNGGGMYKVWLQLLSPAGEYVWPAPAGILVSVTIRCLAHRVCLDG